MKIHLCDMNIAWTLVASATSNAETGAGLIGQLAGIILRCICGSESTEDSEDDEGRCYNDGDLAQDGLASTKLSPLAVAVSNIALELLIAELVVDHATESNRVSEELNGSDLGAPDRHGGGDQQDILEDTTESEDDSRGLANL